MATPVDPSIAKRQLAASHCADTMRAATARHWMRGAEPPLPAIHSSTRRNRRRVGAVLRTRMGWLIQPEITPITDCLPAARSPVPGCRSLPCLSPSRYGAWTPTTHRPHGCVARAAVALAPVHRPLVAEDGDPGSGRSVTRILYLRLSLPCGPDVLLHPSRPSRWDSGGEGDRCSEE